MWVVSAVHKITSKKVIAVMHVLKIAQNARNQLNVKSAKRDFTFRIMFAKPVMTVMIKLDVFKGSNVQPK